VQKQAEWNKPVWWPLVLLAAMGAGLIMLARRSFAARERATARAVSTATAAI
jgi:hypothetical protein